MWVGSVSLTEKVPIRLKKYFIKGVIMTLEAKENSMLGRLILLMCVLTAAVAFAAGENPFEFIKAAFFDILQKYVAWVILGVMWMTFILGIIFGGLPWMPTVITGICATAGVFFFPSFLKPISDWASSYRPTTSVGQ